MCLHLETTPRSFDAIVNGYVASMLRQNLYFNIPHSLERMNQHTEATLNMENPIVGFVRRQNLIIMSRLVLISKLCGGR